MICENQQKEKKHQRRRDVAFDRAGFMIIWEGRHNDLSEFLTSPERVVCSSLTVWTLLCFTLLAISRPRLTTFQSLQYLYSPFFFFRKESPDVSNIITSNDQPAGQRADGSVNGYYSSSSDHVLPTPHFWALLGSSPKLPGFFNPEDEQTTTTTYARGRKRTSSSPCLGRYSMTTPLSQVTGRRRGDVVPEVC